MLLDMESHTYSMKAGELTCAAFSCLLLSMDHFWHIQCVYANTEPDFLNIAQADSTA